MKKFENLGRRDLLGMFNAASDAIKRYAVENNIAIGEEIINLFKTMEMTLYKISMEARNNAGTGPVVRDREGAEVVTNEN